MQITIYSKYKRHLSISCRVVCTVHLHRLDAEAADKNRNARNTFQISKSFIDEYRYNFQSMIDAFATAVHSLSEIIERKRLVPSIQHTHYSPSDEFSSPLVTLDRDTAAPEHLNDELRWLLI